MLRGNTGDDRDTGEECTGGDRDNKVYKEEVIGRLASVSQPVAGETLIVNVTIWPPYLHSPSHLTPPLTNKSTLPL